MVMTALPDTGGRLPFVVDPNTEVCKFLLSNRPVDIIQGPLGSGKTKAMCVRLMRHAQEQVPSPVDRLRYTRFAMVRNTFPDLKRTTIRTWLETFPEHIHGRFNWGQPPYHQIHFEDVRMTVDFLALDKDEDVRKLRSTEYTGIAFNEVPFIPKAIFDEADSRLRYPPMEHGGPNPWRGLIADANAPDEDHWLGIMTGQVEMPPGLAADQQHEYRWPPEWGFYMQPSALLEVTDQRGRVTGYEVNPGAENLKNLPPDYYQRQIRAKKKSWIDSRLMNRIALVVEGEPVWPMFRVEVHVSREVLKPIERHDVVVGLDFGRSPAAVFMQAVNNRVFVQHELIGANEGAVDFAPKVKRFLTEHYAGFTFRCFGDPKGADRGQTDDRTAYDVFASHGMPVSPPPGLKQNMIATRVDAVSSVLNEMYDARPRFVLSPICRTLKVGMAGRYYNERDEFGELKPCKDRYSHPCDALQYGVLGLGEGRRMIGLTAGNQMRPARAWNGRKSMRRVTA
jgi:hypothetical protein